MFLVRLEAGGLGLGRVGQTRGLYLEAAGWISQRVVGSIQGLDLEAAGWISLPQQVVGSMQSLDLEAAGWISLPQQVVGSMQGLDLEAAGWISLPQRVVDPQDACLPKQSFVRQLLAVWCEPLFPPLLPVVSRHECVWSLGAEKKESFI